MVFGLIIQIYARILRAILRDFGQHYEKTLLFVIIITP